ncbi:tetratricopeptide repeat protein [Pediococcus siamensis]|uniref:tetratricopeptide repeat protein n=1 Tax=Pediococcus siamensis TaxID=381829 RepID=UPI0039A1E1ED
MYFELLTNYFECRIIVKENVFFKLLRNKTGEYFMNGKDDFEKIYQDAKKRHNLQPILAELIIRAKNGNTRFQTSLGFAYQTGELPIDYKKSRYWSKCAIANGSVQAITNLAVLYINGQGGSQNLKKGIAMLKDGVKKGDFKALRYLGRCYQKGLGVPIDLLKARSYFVKAAKAGDITSMAYLGDYYCFGMGGVQVDYQVAFRWYKRASKRGDVVAVPGMLGIARMYEQGLGRPHNISLAMKWYNRAAQTGSNSAKKVLQKLKKEKNY